jgi:aspartyl-tRNA(Asn)/glutamyl-tRNA(Gln) amidotransferase subunit C
VEAGPSAIIRLTMALTLDEVQHIAQLARLKLSLEEEQRFASQLSDILDHVQRLQSVDTSRLPPTASILPLTAPLRPDAARPSTPRKALLSNAAGADEGMFRVPPVLGADR